MQPLVVQRFLPRADVQVWTKSGHHYHEDLMGDLVSMRLHRSTDGSPGTFALTLTARTFSDGSWASRVSAMDYVEIRAANAPLQPQMRMRGFVDNAMQSYSIGASGGPTRSITINGRDFTKLFLINKIRYLWQTDPMAALAQQWGLTMMWGIPYPTSTPAAFTKAIMGIMTPFVATLHKETGLPIPGIATSVGIPQRFATPVSIVEPYTGPFWGLFTYFASAPLGEAFVYDSPESPVLVFRVAPFKDAAGNIVSPAVPPELSPVEASLATAPGQDLGRSDNEVRNWFFTYADTASLFAYPQYAYVSKGNPTINQPSIDTYGFQPQEVSTPWLTPFFESPGSKSPTVPQEQAIELAQYLLETQGHNELLASGSLEVHGSHDLIPGRYVAVPEEGLTFYLQTVDETFDFLGQSNPHWRATLGLVRGQPS